VFGVIMSVSEHTFKFLCKRRNCVSLLAGCRFFSVRNLQVDTGKSIEACAERNTELIMISVYVIHLSRLSVPKILPGIRESEV
jgi:hypothetical protein